MYVSHTDVFMCACISLPSFILGGVRKCAYIGSAVEKIVMPIWCISTTNYSNVLSRPFVDLAVN